MVNEYEYVPSFFSKPLIIFINSILLVGKS